MNPFFYISMVLLFFLSGKSYRNDFKMQQESSFQSVRIDTILNQNISIRALHVDGNKIWYGADKSRFGFIEIPTKKQTQIQFIVDSLEFRSIFATSSHFFVLSVGSPAILYRVNKETNNGKVVYEEQHKKAFYDSMQFWNATEGIAMGDPTEDCLSIIITRDGGNSWKKIPCKLLPKVAPGEAAFAASNTNIVVKGSKTWIVSGGVQSRVFYSPDKGKSWEVFNTPIISGKGMTGIFTADFYNEKIGFIAGGDYENQPQNSANKAMTKDGGKTWKLVGEHQGFGYASCVQFVPNGKGKQVVSVGASGLHYSLDSGATWKQLLKDDTLFTIRFQNDSTAFAAGKNKIIRIQFKK